MPVNQSIGGVFEQSAGGVRKDECILLMGGQKSGTDYNWVWRSYDGISWTQLPDAPWAARRSHTATLFNGQVYILGGVSGTGGSIAYYDDIYKYTPYVGWQSVGESTAIGTRYNHTCVVFNGYMYIIGGVDGSGTYYADVWRSGNGSTWSQVTDDGGFGVRSLHACAAYDGKLWIMGGYSGTGAIFYEDLWYSSDGATWVEVTHDISNIADPKLFVYNKKLCTTNNISGLTGFQVTDTEDGVDWTARKVFSNGTKSYARFGYNVVTNGRDIYIIGGGPYTTNLPDVIKGKSITEWSDVVEYQDAPWSSLVFGAAVLI